MVNEKVVKLLNEQINLETFSSYLYLEIANYFMDEGLDGFNHWFNMQLKEELIHSRLIIDYLHENNVSIKLSAIEDPSRDYKSHMEALKEVLEHEQLITRSIHNIYDVAMQEKDFRSMQFLDWFIEEQAEEEANANELIDKYNLYGDDKKGLYLLNQELGARVEPTNPKLAAE